MKILSLRILLVLSLVLGFGTAGPVWAAASTETTANVKIEQWTGQNFTFLNLPSDTQSEGYDIFTVEQSAQGLHGDRSVRIPYDKHVGKQVTVTQVVPFAAGNDQPEYMVYMTVNDTGEKLLGRSMRGQLEGLVLTSDLNNAREQFLGKTVYPKFRQLSGLYVPGATPQAVSTTLGGPVTVVDVYAGNHSQEPIWLIVSANGQKAILPIAYSFTNTPVQSWTQTSAWQDALFAEDPKISLGGSEDVWKQIQAGNIQEGMTKGQVQLSWSKPFRVEANDSVWIYGTKKLSFDGDVLHSIEGPAVTSAETPIVNPVETSTVIPTETPAESI